MSRLHSVVIHCADPVRMARFWSAVVALPPAAVDAAYVSGAQPIPDGESIKLTDGVTTSLWLTPPGHLDPIGNRLHLDVALDDRRQVAEWVGLGARLVRIEEKWTVLADPEGNEFCAIHPA